MSGWGAVAGACAASGALLVLSGVQARRPLRPVDRIAPYVSTRGQQPSGLLESSTLGRILAPTLEAVGARVRSWLSGDVALERRLVAAGRRPEEVSSFRVSQLTWALTGMLVAVVAVGVMATTGRMRPGPAPVSLLLLAGIPFQVRMLLRIDDSRRAAQLGNSVGLIGISIGPSIIALGVSGADVRGAFWIAAGLLLLTTATYSWLRVKTRL